MLALDLERMALSLPAIGRYGSTRSTETLAHAFSIGSTACSVTGFLNEIRTKQEIYSKYSSLAQAL